MTYPKGMRENLGYRHEILTKCETDEYFCGVVRELFKRDVLFAFNTFFVTYDPRLKGGKDVPFVTYPFQDETILEINRCIEQGENLFADKSRDMGMTYMVLYVFLWRWLTRRGESFKIGSRKEDYVDKPGDMDSLFEKLRYQLKFLPYFLLPRGWDFRKNSAFMRLMNPELGCSIIGEATNADFARGGRNVAVFFDEFEAWDETAEQAWRSATDSTRCKMVVGTPKGSGNKFAELSRTSEVKNKLHLLWHRHPLKSVTSSAHLELVKLGKVRDKVQGYVVEVSEKTAPEGCYVDQYGKVRSEWYDLECEQRSKEDIAENLDCNYLTSGQPYFDTLICDENLRYMAREPIKVGDIHWKVAPRFDSQTGYCSNMDDLSVEFVESFNGKIKIWEEPLDGWENGYVIPADVAEGLEQGDYSSASVLKRFGDKPEVVAALHGHMKIFEYVEELARLGVYYKKAYIAPERNKDGSAVILQLLKMYRWLWHKDVITKGYPQATDKIGFETSNRHVKHAVCGELQRAISKKEIVDPDADFWRETMTFVNNDGALEAQGKSQGQKCFDDRVMDRAIGLWVSLRMPAPIKRQEKIEYRGWRKDWDKPRKGGLLRFAV